MCKLNLPYRSRGRPDGRHESTIATEGAGEKRPSNNKEAQGEEPAVSSTRLYTSLDSVEDDLISLSGYKAEDLHEAR